MGSGQDWFTSAEQASAATTTEAVLPFEMGRYRILRRLGAGGMGIVYEAEQQQPRRSVAVKVLRAALGSDAQLARFQAEAQRLADLNHPHIARVIEAGVETRSGLQIPYYVLELIPGARPITTYAADEALDPRQRIGLFLGVCDAVHHANECGVLHCDLKPGNILVDQRGEPKLIDFGIARALREDGDATFSQTISQEIRGTLPYLCPEQCGGGAGLESLDRRCDVYALGVVLYELLCGSLPYDVLGKGVAEVTRIIREQPPVRPTRRNVKLGWSVDAVLLKALEKEPARRYGSAAELAADLQRLLAGEVPRGRAPGLGYRTSVRVRRFASRQWPVAVVVGSVLASALAVTVGSKLDNGGASGHFERLLTANLRSVPSAPFRQVQILAITDDTDLQAIARAEGIDDFSPDVTPSLRLLHGRFMEKLAASGAGAVACDLFLRKESAYDEGFIRGVQRLRERGIPVVLAVPSWELGQNGRPILSPTILPHVAWGGASGHMGRGGPWSAHLMFKRGSSRPLPSLVLATVAAFRQPQTAWGAEFGLQSIEIQYTGAALGKNLTIPISNLEQLEGSAEQFGLQRDDFLGQFVVQVPSDSDLARSIVDYNDLHGAGTDQLREWFAGKVVMLADLREGRDGPFPHPDGRRLPGSFLHATAIEQVLAGQVIRRSLPLQWGVLYFDGVYLAYLAAAIVGAATGLLWVSSRRRTATVCGLGGASATIAASVAAFPLAGVLISPVVPVALITSVAASVSLLGTLRRPLM